MDAIVSVTRDWAIGNRGRLLVRNKADMRRFATLTQGCAVLMGRATFESLPKGPLKGRRNIVVSHERGYVRDGFPREGSKGSAGYEVYVTPGDALAALGDRDAARAWLIGGESLYRALLPRCERVLVTKSDVVVPADAFFPNLDEDPGWQLVEHSFGGVTDEGIAFEYVTYATRGTRA